MSEAKILLYVHIPYLALDLHAVNGAMFDVIGILAIALLLALIVLLLVWMSTRQADIIMVPFENTTGDTKYGGGAISDSIMAEIQRINDIHHFPTPSTRELVPLPYQSIRIAPEQESLGEVLRDLGTVGLGDTKLSIGELLETMRRLWPIGGQPQLLRGSLQRYGSVVRLVAHLDNGQRYRSDRAGERSAAARKGRAEVRSWEVGQGIADDDKIPELIKNLSFKIANDLSPDLTAQTWLAFKHYTEALESYRQYTSTDDVAYLHATKDHCLASVKVEPRYQHMWGLLGVVGQSYTNRELYVEAEEILQYAVRLAPRRVDKAETYILLGIVHKECGDFHAALRVYQQALRLGPDCAFYYNGVGYVYLRLDDFPQALSMFQRAVELDDTNGAFHASVAGLYRRMKRSQEAEQEIVRARTLISNDAYEKAYLEAIAGNVREAARFLQQAIDQGQTTVGWLRYDPDLDFIRGEREFHEVVEEAAAMTTLQAG